MIPGLKTRNASASHTSHRSGRGDSHVSQNRQQDIDPYHPTQSAPIHPRTETRGEGGTHRNQRRILVLGTRRYVRPVITCKLAAALYREKEGGGAYTGGRMTAKICGARSQSSFPVRCGHPSDCMDAQRGTYDLDNISTGYTSGVSDGFPGMKEGRTERHCGSLGMVDGNELVGRLVNLSCIRMIRMNERSEERGCVVVSTRGMTSIAAGAPRGGERLRRANGAQVRQEEPVVPQDNHTSCIPRIEYNPLTDSIHHTPSPAAAQKRDSPPPPPPQPSAARTGVQSIPPRTPGQGDSTPSPPSVVGIPVGTRCVGGMGCTCCTPREAADGMVVAWVRLRRFGMVPGRVWSWRG